MIMRKRLLPVLVAALTVFSMMQISAGSVHAASGDPAMDLGTAVLDQNVNTSDAQTVWYADKTWRVISYDGRGAAGKSGAVTLLAARNLDQTQFDSSGSNSNVYASSTLKTKVDATAESFSDGEQGAVIKRTLLQGDYYGSNTDCIAGDEDIPDVLLWPLSTKEASVVNENLRILDPEHTSWETSCWWLRSPGAYTFFAALVHGNGGVDGTGYNVDNTYGVRPAFYLNPESVLFTSAAESGKSSGAEGADALKAQSAQKSSGDEWKVTLRFEHEDFEISEGSDTVNGVEFQYTGAAVGTEDKPEYISAIITDKPVTDSSATIKYYGRIQNCTSESGSVTIDTAGKLGDNEHLYVFNEQYNGDKSTDYSSALQEVMIPISYDVTFKVTNGLWNDGTAEDKTVTLNGYKGYTLKLAAEQIPAVGNNPNEDCRAGNWDTPPDEDTAITDNTTYIYTYIDQQVENVIALIEALPEVDAMKRTDVAAVRETKNAYDALTESQQAQIDADLTARLNEAVDKASQIVAEAAEAADLRDQAVVYLAYLNRLVDGSLYTAASYKDYADAYQTFNELVNDDEATTEQLRDARSAVIKAYTNLEKKTDISSAKITGLTAVNYTGKAQTQTPVVTLDGVTLAKDTEYTVSYKNNTNAGTATVIVTGTGDNHMGTATATFKINKIAQKMTATAKAKTVKVAKVKKAKQTVAPITVKNAQGTVTYKKAGGSAKLTVNAKTGKVTVKKGTKKGTYKCKVKVTAKGNTNYNALSKTVTVTVKVKK